MDNLDTEAAMEIADEVARIAWAAMTAIERISRTAQDPACARAAKLALGTTLLAQTVTTEAEAATVNATWAGWRMVRVH
jgi:hypothetical protein